MRISDWSSDVCSSDLGRRTCSAPPGLTFERRPPGRLFFGSSPNSGEGFLLLVRSRASLRPDGPGATCRPSGQMSPGIRLRSEEHTSELLSLMRISYAVFCLKQKKNK